MVKKIALVIAECLFRDEEYQVPRDILKSEGYEVLTVSTTLGIAHGKLGMEVIPDLLLESLTVEQADALIFIGGGGSSQYFEDRTAHLLAKRFVENNKILGAICIAPVILAKAGLLMGKRATVFPDGEGELIKGGASYTGKPVEIDGSIITGNGPESVEEFSQKLVVMLKI